MPATRRARRSDAAGSAPNEPPSVSSASRRVDKGPFRLPGTMERDDAKRCGSWRCAVCDIEETPEWMVWNPHVRTGYRVGARWSGATRSLFMWHNDTVNIWSHFLGMLMFVALIVRTFQAAHGGVGLAAPPEHWVTGADVARVERIQYATRWRQEIRRDWDDLRRIDLELHERYVDRSDVHDAVHDVGHELLNVTHALADHLESGEEGFKVQKRRKKLQNNLRGAQKALDEIEKKGGPGFSAISSQCAALRKKLDVLNKHIQAVPDDPEPARPVARWPMYVFLAGAIFCLFLSTMCHTYCCVGKEESENMWRLDYLGIATLIVSSFYPIVHYSYYCLPGFRNMYLTGITALGCLTLIPTFLKAFQKQEYAHLRASLFVALGGSGIFPLLQQIFFVWRVVPTPVIEAFRWEMAMGFGYVFGAFLYGCQIPERFSPGSFDYFGCSHNLFHFLVVLSAWFHFKASMLYLIWRDNFTCEADHELLLDWYHLGSHFRQPL